MIFVAGGTLAFFFEFLLLSKKPKFFADKILTFWMFIIGVHLFLFYFHSSGIEFKYPHLLGIGIPLPLIHGPILFLYTGALTNYFSKWKTKYLLHFLPVFVFLLYFFEFFISTGEEKIEFFDKMPRNPDIALKLLVPAIIISGFIYIILTFLLFRNHRKNILNNLSNSDSRNNLDWLRYLIIGLLSIWIVVFSSRFFVNSNVSDYAIYTTVALFVVLMGYFGMRQGNIFTNIPENALITNLTYQSLPITSSKEFSKSHDSSDNSEINIIDVQAEPITEDLPFEKPIAQSFDKTQIDEQSRYSKSGLKDERAEEIQKQLLKLMDEKKLFLNENISLPELSKILNIHPNYLSQVINERLQKNFYDFINSYRIEEFKRVVKMEKNKNKTFFALALDCGFNSKASFNSSFKKITGITPSEFVKSL